MIRPLLSPLLLLISLWAVRPVFGQDPPISAFEALGLIPPEAAKRVAVIEGRDGVPMPERWYLVVYDPAQEHRLTEYVVAGRRVVAVRPFSQFVQELSPDEIIRVDPALINSDRVFQILEQFARANNLRVAKINYRLKKDGVGCAPLWKVSCLDDSATPFAGMVVAANSGTIVQTSGFNLPPSALPSLANLPRRPLPQSTNQDQSRTPNSKDSPNASTAKTKKPEQAVSAQKRNRAKSESRRQVPPEPVAERRVGIFGAFRDLFRGHD